MASQLSRDLARPWDGCSERVGIRRHNQRTTFGRECRCSHANVTWQEPQVLVDLLAMNLVADRNKMTLRGPRMIAVVSPWLSDVEIGLRAGAWHQQITVGEATSASLQTILTEYCRAVGHARSGLAYG